jgi:ATP-dependent DNA helicase RecQ
VNRLPETPGELSKIKGIGKSKTKQYGHQIIEMVRKFKQANQIQVKQQTLEIPKKEPTAKIPNHKLTFLVYQEKGSVEEVIRSRGLSRATVIKHLGMYVQSGEIDLYELVDRKKAERITRYFEQAESKQLKPAKEALGDDVSYDDLHLVLSYITGNSI